MELNIYFHKVLKEVQWKYPNIIPDLVSMEEDFSTFWLLRQSATSESKNARITEAVVNMNNRWRKLLRADGMKLEMSMMEHYMEVKVIVPTIICFPKKYQLKSNKLTS